MWRSVVRPCGGRHVRFRLFCVKTQPVRFVCSAGRAGILPEFLGYLLWRYIFELLSSHDDDAGRYGGSGERGGGGS
jgi:hypothetical protein